MRFPRFSLIPVAFSLLAMPAQADQVTLFAAASLKDALDNIEPAFEAATGHDLTVSLAGSSALARQIQHGAPADLFISANVEWMDALEDEGLLEPESRRDLLSNRLVLIGPPVRIAPLPIDSSFDIASRLGDGRLAMALVDAVPAGIYGKAALEHLGMWDSLEAQVAQADNVRAALALVALRESPLGIVYATDARAEPRVSVIGTFPEDSHPPITYPMARLSGADSDAALALSEFLVSSDAAAAFAEAGFTVLLED